VETVRFTRPERVDFRLVRGPVPLVVEAFVISELARRTAALDRAQDDVDGRERAADQRDRDAFQCDRKASETE
jgi:hypothetical protein